MTRTRRANSFLLEPRRYVTDRAIVGMSDAGRGCYSMLFMNGWDQPEVGVYPDDDRVLAQFAMTSPENWAVVRAEVALAFDLNSRPGWWVQKGLVKSLRAQDVYMRRQSAAGRASAKARWGKEKGNGRITDPQPGSEFRLQGRCNPSVLGSVLGSENLSLPVSSETGFPVALIHELEAKHPRLDVESIALKLANHPAEYRNRNLALRQWCRKADREGWDRKPKRLTFGEEQP